VFATFMAFDLFRVKQATLSLSLSLCLSLSPLLVHGEQSYGMIIVSTDPSIKPPTHPERDDVSGGLFPSRKPSSLPTLAFYMT
jgi:hypothetical protein